MEDIKSLIEYQDVASDSDSNNHSEEEGSDNTGEQYITSSEEDGSSTEKNAQVENENPNQVVDFLEAPQLQIAQNENIPFADHPNEAQDFNSSDDDLLIFENDEEREQYVIESLREWKVEIYQ